ncbi:UBX domain-containing protein 11 [Centroberyx affinis]|uniref:UBX domain-containing protein 11 n=1 Tax=Centroberyx affinis TaxID=166261 RepID=UPI003A5C50D0
MSSPLSMLKKTRRTPLQNQQWGRGRVPYRGNLLTDYEATQLEDDPSDVNPPPVSHVDAVSTSKSKAPLKKGAPPSDFELMSSMMQRLTQLETKVKSQAQEIERKDKKISVLEERLKLLKKSESAGDLSDRDDLVGTCHQLQTQVHEMERFLSDYGMIWVGDGETRCRPEGEEAERLQPQSSERGVWQPGSSVVRNFCMNFDLVLQNIRELNILAGEGESFVQATARGAQLARQEPIQLRLYSNGIVMFDGPFRFYQERSTQQCMQDLMDGYFPSELQGRFPDGVPFEVHDRREEEFIDRRPWAEFPGKGQVVAGATEKGKSSNATSSQTPGKKLSMDQFLNRLPKVVVKAGRVIDIRDSVRATLQGSSGAQNSNSVTLVETPALQAMKERLEMCDSDRPSSARDVTTLRVKSEDGNHSYILKMRFSETIGDLRQHLDKLRGEGVSGYDIISVYPQCCYSDDCQTLLSCGLTPNATLLLRPKQSNSLTDSSK